jgi:signal peptidase II
MPGKYRSLCLIVGLSIVLDLWTKALIRAHFRYGEVKELLDPVFALTYVRNRGAAFSFMNNAPPAIRDPFFVAVPCIALVGIFLYFRKLRNDQKCYLVALSLIAGGALGNLIDRLRFGFVTDFLDLHWKEVYHWPRFNVADSCIVVGVALIFLHSLFQSSENQ